MAVNPSLEKQMAELQIAHFRTLAALEVDIKREELAKAKAERETQEIIRERVRNLEDIERLPEFRGSA